MKVYVNELPKECFECPCFRNDIDICCGLDDGTKDYHNFLEDSNCPLKTIHDLKQQLKDKNCELQKEIDKAKKEIEQLNQQLREIKIWK